MVDREKYLARQARYNRSEKGGARYRRYREENGERIRARDMERYWSRTPEQILRDCQRQTLWYCRQQIEVLEQRAEELYG